jgi:hypothetical protein
VEVPPAEDKPAKKRGRPAKALDTLAEEEGPGEDLEEMGESQKAPAEN